MKDNESTRPHLGIRRHIRVVRRTPFTPPGMIVFRAVALAAALGMGALLILLLGYPPGNVYIDMLKGAFGSRTFAVETVRKTVQLLLVGLSVALSFKVKFYNIGAESQLMAGALAASYFALFQAENMPRILLVVVMMLCAALAGGILALIPAIFKAKWEINEVLFTLMLNYVMVAIAKYLQNGPWKDPSGSFPRIALFSGSARLSNVLGLNWGWIFTLFMVVAIWIYLKRTKQGYEIAVVGESRRTAKYVGINYGMVIMRTMLISGAIAGIAGFFQVAGIDYTVGDTTGGGLGYTAITVAWLANLNPFGMLLTSLLLSVLDRGASYTQTTFKIPASASSVLTGIILVFMLGCEFFLKYRFVFGGGREAADE